MQSAVKVLHVSQNPASDLHSPLCPRIQVKAPAAKAEASGRGAGGFLSQLDGAGGPQAGDGPAGGAGLLAPPPQPSPAVRWPACRHVALRC